MTAAVALAELELSSDVRERTLRWLRYADSIDLDAVTLGQFIGVGSGEAARIGDAFVRRGIFIRRDQIVCSNDDCGVSLSDDSLRDRRCSSCGADLDEIAPTAVIHYVLLRPRARDVGWMIALHGIRTRGPWQEELQWLVDRQFLRTVPFKNWKYGHIFLRALVPALQQRLVRRFIGEVRTAQTELIGVLRAGAPPPPDVIAHSFGSWIVAHALVQEPTLRIGRLILIGSILRPDWDWRTPLEQGRLDAVLNYAGECDSWVRVAERFIPDSGPSGRIGFVTEDPRVVNVIRRGGSHSTAFHPAALQGVYDDYLRPFLAGRPSDIEIGEGHQPREITSWNRAKWVFRAPTTTLLVCLVIAILVANPFGVW